MRKGTQLPRTSRVSEKIIEYYMKFGQERDLEKYMRLHSPCEQRSNSRSRSTTTTTSSCQSEDDGRVFRRLFHHEVEVTTESDSDMKDLIVPIDVQTEKMSGNGMKLNGDECTSSAPDLHTPPPRAKIAPNSKETQTPESVVKSHRRLEWDSLGDVGYRKSLSTSNISILERSVLREYFQEISTIHKTFKDKKAADSNSNTIVSKSEEPKETSKSKTTTKKQPLNHNTPPLASSTMMDNKSGKENIPSGSRPKLVSKSTSMSLQKRYDQCAQTSIQRLPQLTSREVQVTLSSATSVTSSNAAGTATPSSFDYYSSRSTNSTTDGGVAVNKSSLIKGHTNIVKSKEHQKQIHPFIAGINKMLHSRKEIGSRKCGRSKTDNTSSLQQVHDTLEQVLNENNENTTSSSTLLNSTQLDLGIQLLCSLIDARSLTQRQKKKLVRDIVKRITTLNKNNDADVEENTAASRGDNVSAKLSTRNSPRPDQEKMQTSLKSTSTVKVARTAKTSMDMSALTRDLPPSSSSTSFEQLIQTGVHQKSSPPTTSAKAAAKTEEKTTKKLERMTELFRAGTLVENINVPKLTDIADANIKKNQENLESHAETPTNEHLKLGNNTEKGSSASKASTTSIDVTTQKALINIENAGTSDTDLDIAAHSTMREWLNPLTQSEIEYEEKKLEYARNATKRDKIKKCLDNENFDTERKSQLKWIQAEIKRLEILRCLLLKSSIERNNVADIGHNIDNDANTHEVDNLYDTVFTEPKRASVISSTTSSAHSSCDNGKPLQEIEVIIEESNEDVIELDEKIKRSKQRKRETQIVYDKPNDGGNIYNNLATGRARFRTMTETITTNEEQVLPSETVAPTIPIPSSPSPDQLATDTRRQQQRSKIATPSCDSNDDESVDSFAKQRKREFLEHYRNKKRLHYESLLHQQQQLLIQQQQQIIQELQQRCNTIAHQGAAAAAPEHYSVPHNMPIAAYCSCTNQQQQAYFQQPCHGMRVPQPHVNHERPPVQPHAPPCPPRPPRVQSHTAAGVNYSHKTQTIHSEQSTSSIFCISSEVSIPMGSSSGTTSTTTTTHQYDDAAAVCGATTNTTTGVGIQTGASLRRTQPIFGRRMQIRNVPNWSTYNPQPVCSGQSISVQVKPKAIAYVIQFDKKTTTSTTTITTTTTSTSSNTSLSKLGKESANDMRDAETKPCALQDYLERAKPQFVAHTKERKAILNQIQALRLERGKELRDIIENASENSLDTRLQRLPPPATKRLRIFATKEMKAMTQRHFENLPEVVKQQERVREERRRHGNRMIRDIFNQRLQRRARTGKLSLNHSKTVI